MRVKKSLPTDRKYTSALIPDFKIKMRVACKICYLFCRKGGTKAYILVYFFVSYKKPKSLHKKLRTNIIQSEVW